MTLGAIFGFQTGIIASIFYVSSGFAGMWAAHKFAIDSGIGFYLVFAAGAGVVVLVGFIIGKLLKAVFLGLADRLIGLFLGLLLGAVIVGVVVMPVARHFPAKIKKAAFSSFSGSKIVPYLQKLYPKLKDFSVEDIKESLPMPNLPDKIEIKIPKLTSNKK